MSEFAKRPLVIFTYVVLVVSTLLVFWQVHNFDFVNYDDNDYVYQNLHVSHGLTQDGIIWAFTTGYATNWHPLTWLSLMLDCQLFGINPGWMHLVNLFLHLANTLLLFAVLKKMTSALWPSAFVAAAFALHPMHVESVVWIAERKDVLSTFFLLLTLAAYAGYVKRPSVFRYISALALFAFGLMAKPMLVTLPFVLLLLDYWPLNRFDAQGRKHTAGAIPYRVVIEKIPFFILAAASSVTTFLVQQAGGALANTSFLPLHSRIANAFLSYVKYIGKMFWPENLAAFYPFDVGVTGPWEVALCVLLMIVVTAGAIRYGRKQKYLVVGWLWFVAALVPVIGIVQVGGQAFADRYTYIPYIGLFIMIAWGLPELFSKWPQRKIVLGVAATMALMAMGTGAYRQVSYWKNSSTLFSHAIEVTQNNYLAHYIRGVAYIKLGRYHEAIEDLKEAVRIKPNYADAYNDLGFANSKFGRWQEAIEDFRAAIKIRPDYADTHYNLGMAYIRLGRYQEAIEAFGQAIRIKHGFAEAYKNRGSVYSNLGRSTEAIEDFKEAIKIRPGYVQAINDLAWLIATSPYVKDPDTNEAIRLATRACELANYKDAAFLDTLAAAYASAARFSKAIDTANKALNLADAANQPQLKDIIQQHLSLYRQGRPYVEPGPKP